MSVEEEGAKALQEVAKTTSKAIGAVEKAGGFLAEVFKEPIQEQVGIWTDNLKFKRWENQQAIIAKARARMVQLGDGAPLRQIPMRVGVPLLEAASLAEEDELRERWANLLVNFANEASGVAVQPAFISILRELSPLEVAILDKVYSLPPVTPASHAVLTAKLPEEATREQGEPKHPIDTPRHDVGLAIANLFRLGCLSPATAWDGGEILGVVYQSTLGRALYEACASPGDSVASEGRS